MDSTKLKIEAELAELEHSNHGGGGEEEEEEGGGGGGGSDRIDLSVGRSVAPPVHGREERGKADRWPAVPHTRTHTQTHS